LMQRTSGPGPKENISPSLLTKLAQMYVRNLKRKYASALDADRRTRYIWTYTYIWSQIFNSIKTSQDILSLTINIQEGLADWSHGDVKATKLLAVTGGKGALI